MCQDAGSTPASRINLKEGKMNFIKLGKRYINLDAIAAVVPRKKGLGYTVSFIGGKDMDICEMDMVDIKKALDMAATTKVAFDEINTIASYSPSPEEILETIKVNQPTTKENHEHLQKLHLSETE